MAEGVPKLWDPWGRADDGQHVGKTRPTAQPRLLIDRTPKAGNQGVRDRHGPLQLNRGGPGVAAGEFGAGCEPEALLHGRQEVAFLGIQQRPPQRPAGLHGEMHVVAALHEQRRSVAERMGHLGCPGAQGDDSAPCAYRTLIAEDLPRAGVSTQGSSVATKKSSAEAFKQAAIRECEQLGVGYGERPGPMNRTGEAGLQCRFLPLQGARV